jgi:hypothetical protein
MKFLRKVKGYYLNLNRLDRITLLTIIFPNYKLDIFHKFPPLLKINTKSVETIALKDK